MKRNHWKIGQQHNKPFPVAHARLHVAEKGHYCNIDHLPALFGISFFNMPMDEIQGLAQVLSRKELHEVAWERAYRMQQRGEDEESPSYPICVQCALKHITEFLNKPEGEGAAFIAGAVTTGKSILLFDRNLRRDMTHPGIALGFFESLEDFREQYWQEVTS